MNWNFLEFENGEKEDIWVMNIYRKLQEERRLVNLILRFYLFFEKCHVDAYMYGWNFLISLDKVKEEIMRQSKF